MLYTVLMISEVLLSIGIITLVLMQHGKGADAGAAFGSGASGTVFGSKGAGNFLTRTTAILAALFFLNCLGLAYIVSYQSKSATRIESVIDAVGEAGAVQDKATSVPSAADIPQPDVPSVDEAKSGSKKPADIPE
ncbi:MAG TPA: preprotein translocase subunit SecG [Gammaproteobacteria bacterium]|nr:preprotein translocase subunit SecG [Gammaproteobacteria bacterium]